MTPDACPHCGADLTGEPIPEWSQDIAAAPKDGTRIEALVETTLFMEKHIPAALMGGWKRCAERDRIVGWRPFRCPDCSGTWPREGR